MNAVGTAIKRGPARVDYKTFEEVVCSINV
jgi:hypothetical protein